MTLIVKKKKQHYIPRFYLKYFSNNEDKKTIGIYNIKKEIFISIGSLKNQAYSSYFYGKDGNIEEGLSILEGHAADLISKMLKAKWVPEYGTLGHKILLTFIIFLSARTTYAADSMDEMLDKLIKKIFEEDPRVKDYLDKINIRYENPAAFSLAITSEVLLAGIISDLEFKLLVNNTETVFIPSDNPVVKYNQFLANKKTYGGITGFVIKGLQMMLPLNPRVYLIFYDKSVYKVGTRKHRVIEIKNNKDIDELNILQFVNANNNFYFNHEIDERCITLIEIQGRKYRSEKKVNIKEYQEVTQSSERKKASLIQTYPKDVKTKLSLSFISITKKAKKYKLGNKVVHIRSPKIIDKYEKLTSGSQF